MILTTRPVLAFALVPPVMLVLAGQIAAGESQRRADRNEFLYRTTEILHSTRQVGERAGELLNDHKIFGVERAELVVIPEVRGPAVRSNSTRDDATRAGHHSELTFAEQEVLNELRTTAILSGPLVDTISRSALRLPNGPRQPGRLWCSGTRGPPGDAAAAQSRRGVKLGAHEAEPAHHGRRTRSASPSKTDSSPSSAPRCRSRCQNHI